MALVTLARLAMATRFEIVLHGENPVMLRAAGEEALDEIDRLEAQLSLYRPGSEIARLNACAGKEPVRVTPSLFALLEHARRLHGESGGAFDITVAPLVRCWGFMGGSGRRPSAGELAEARARVGMHLVQLDAEKRTVRFERDGVMLDLGAIGKGYAIERAVELLREAGMTSVLLHGGTSTVYALGHPPEAEFWNVAVDNPARERPTSSLPGPPEAATARDGLLATVPLKDEALSVSAVRGKFFREDGKTFGHVLDPRTGQPADAALLAAVVLPSATETDALSTALLTAGAPGHDAIADLRPGMRTLLIAETDGRLQFRARNIAVNQNAV
jgi:thiamine biosynthesis lipoprotein